MLVVVTKRHRSDSNNYKTLRCDVFQEKKNKRDERLTEWTDDDHDDYTAVESPTIHHISMKRKKVN